MDCQNIEVIVVDFAELYNLAANDPRGQACETFSMLHLLHASRIAV